ncbi:hypothetical protein AYI68_g4842 [Smittium mucronatum]|uniref:Uncharacterized protein n=1 Tax=Smittium mucronatum TaxID=133383 RepID=A0A1R0GVX7_9FUNG|nr:hypothetical protein AYI68_g4842 [Smittium mucronatum]
MWRYITPAYFDTIIVNDDKIHIVSFSAKFSVIGEFMDCEPASEPNLEILFLSFWGRQIGSRYYKQPRKT